MVGWVGGMVGWWVDGGGDEEGWEEGEGGTVFCVGNQSPTIMVGVPTFFCRLL